jgi:predicted DsbA family dithiol-disulfide isomerase
MSKEGQNVAAHISKKYGTTLEQQRASKRNMTEVGAGLGFKFDCFDGMRMVNSFDAHILLEYACTFDKKTKLTMRFATAFFSERKDVSNRDVLKQALLAVGLNVEKGIAKLENETARNKIRTKQAYWKNLGVNSLPTIIFNRKSAVTGAQPGATFKKILSKLIAKKLSF